MTLVQHNMNAINAYNKLNANVAGLKKSSEKLASGYRINRAGDDAAGLAISEKMRSQIRGLNQAVRNSQDGINMIQTYEGAAQESHNILQRMKELAEEAANGTYQNEVDREAAMLEFTQLNDELNQIADTDFNGVVMLNGGQMADGALAVNGKFDYVNGTFASAKLGKGDVNILDGQGFNNTDPDTAIRYADAFWNALNPQWSRTDSDSSNDGPESVDITFQYDKTSGTWTAISANNGANYKNVTIVGNGNGGFSVTTQPTTMTRDTWTQKHIDAGGDLSGYYANQGDANTLTGNAGAGGQDVWEKGTETVDVPGTVLADVVIDESKLNNGDTITLTFNNPATKKAAPNNIGADPRDTSNFTEIIGGSQAIDMDLLASIDNTVLTNDDMSADLYKLLQLLDGADIVVNYKADDNGTEDAKGLYDMSITLTDGTIFNFKDIALGEDATSTLSVNGSVFDFKFTQSTDGTDAGKLEIMSNGNALITLTTGTNVAADTQDADGNATKTYSTGNITYKLGLENYKFGEGSDPFVEVAKTGSVSKANSNKTATAPLTYTDNLTLQTGARTKDSVNFTFEYSTAGMGGLKANLNISARADGLATDGLSLLTQEDANTAIDHINNAINKVSMIRATFGATQNRLEHKITNLTTTSENLQEAESAIRDTDMASEMMNYTKFNILQQAAQSMLAQANAQPQSILQLLG